MERVSKINYYLDIAQTISKRGTCIRKKYGSIIVKNDSIISTGYAGAPRGRKNCCDMQKCMREELNIPRGERYELCRSVHSEMNAIIAAPRETMLGADLFLVCTEPKTGAIVGGTCSCQMCKRVIINAGISRVFVRETEDTYTVYDVQDWIENDDSLGTIGY
ncbi:cytidine deaminase [Eubacteriales bacterium OttesenSCG-928-G02]|nr:cytidine deaminase [Eubacteriales bacterium OttesenSCG-928-G02]